jgi:hypothetical protein
MTSADMDEALDWLGRPVDCKACRYADRLADGKCQPLKACVHDRYAKRVQRFFQWNEDLAVENLDHPYFEVRAIAVRHAPLFHLPRLMDDIDETVRSSVARRLPRRLLLKMRNDHDREVRISVASRLEEGDLAPMMRDAD